MFGLFRQKRALSPPAPSRGGGGWLRIMEAFSGAWQKNIEVDFQSVLSFHAVFGCVTLIASDIAKLRVKLVELGEDGIWVEVKNPAYDPVLRKPNHYQNRIQFWETWMLSKLLHGNTYVLKQRDIRGVVNALYVLDPCRVRPLVSDSGAIFYELQPDNLGSQETETITVPARDIIHDRWNCLFHPLCGVSPIYASGVAAMQGLAIQNNSASFFGNRSMPSGILSAPGSISEETATRLKEHWESNYSGTGAGKVAVLGDDLSFKAMAMTAVDSQLIEQLKWSAEVVCSTFHVPGYKIGVGNIPANTNVQALNLEYYSQALQRLIEDAELCLDEGLDMKGAIGTEFDIDNLLRMDSVSQIDFLDKATGIMKLDEQRQRLNLPPLPMGGNTVYLQQQDFSVEALAKRDAKDDPFNKSDPVTRAIEPSAINVSAVKAMFSKKAA